MLAFCTLNFTDIDDSKEKTSAKSFRRNLFGKSSGSSSDTVPPSEYVEFGANGKQMGSSSNYFNENVNPKKNDRPLFDPYTGRKLDDAEESEELNSSNEKLGADDMMNMLNVNKRNSSGRKRKGPPELAVEQKTSSPYQESEDKQVASDDDIREEMCILTIVEAKVVSLRNMFNKRLMEKDINKMTENLALLGRSVMRCDETQGDSFFLCVARELALYQDAEWEMCIEQLRKQLANYIDRNSFAQVLKIFP